MKVSIRGKCPNVTHKEIRYAANFFIEQLISKRLADNIHVKFLLEENKKICDPTDTWIVNWAQIEPEENYWEPPYRRFVITLYPKCKYWTLLKKIAHELVHAKQYAIGDMHDLADTDMVRFRKRRYKQSELKYKDMPWEKEAWAIEGKLYRAYRTHIKQNKITF